MRLSEIAYIARQRQFYSTPYRTGNLAYSVGDLSGYDDLVEYVAFNANSRAEYGAMLNELKEITYKTKVDGKISTGTYPNTHYMWYDNFVSEEADLIDLENNCIRG